MDALLKGSGDAGLASLFQSMQLSMRGLTPNALQGAVLSSGFWLEALLGRGHLAGGQKRRTGVDRAHVAADEMGLSL